MWTRKQTGIFAGLVVILIAAILIPKYLNKSVNDQIPGVPATAVAPTPAANAEKLEFTQSILIHHNGISVDGGGFKTVPCATRSEAAVPFALVTLDQDVFAELTCIDDYMGGVKITYKSPSGELKSIQVGQQEGDAGDQWDLRTLVTKQGDGTLKVESVTLSSSVDELGAVPTECHITRATRVWNKEAKDFVSAEAPAVFTVDNFTLPLFVSRDCLDSNGQWKKTAL